ncbi:MAG TPA: HAMP domain-containing sensor histidine kinase [Bryobacteraceae bacterium]|nr:HAMP domain-containing sensor histidine kinase [Bryobacteraceae bacterium]
MLQKQISARRLLILFAATTVVPAASLVWLGWRMVALDRVLEVRRLEDARNHAVDLSASALQRILAEAEEKLTAFNAAPDAQAPALEDGATLLVLGKSGVLARSGTPLPWYPAIPDFRPVEPATSAAVDDLEFRKEDFAGALRALEELASSKDPAVRGEALQREARIYGWQTGDISKAIAAFNELGTLDNVPVNGLPAGLAARQGRALLFETAGRADDLQREALGLRSDLAGGRWLLTRGEFEFSYYDQVAHWLANAPPEPIRPDRLVLAEAAELLWQDWWPSEQQPTERGRHSIRIGDRSVLLLTRSSPDRLAALLIAPEFLESAWLKDLRSGSKSQQIDYALTDAEGLPVLGVANAPLALQSVRPASATQLPWTVHAIGTDKGLTPPDLSGRTRLLLAGIAMMTLLLLAVAYFINRTVLRELTVARLQSDFVAAVSHEFRTPLTTVRQLSEMLVRGRVSSDERRQQFYETLLRESDRLHKLVEGLLDFARFETGGSAYRFEMIEAGELVRGIVAEFEQRVTPQGFHIEMAASEGEMHVRADREALGRAIWNLLDNAVKYSPDCRTIWVDLRSEAGRVSIAVRDRGLGIPAREQREIFEKFRRGADPKALHIKGTGIGLAMVRTIVQAHGGEILLTSEPGQGSRFTMVFRAAGEAS